MNKRLSLVVSGRVQMVMFRDFTRRQAKALHLVGKVKNEKDGSVSIVAEGDEDSLRALVIRVSKGPLFSRVDTVKEEWADATGEFSDFEIIYYD